MHCAMFLVNTICLYAGRDFRVYAFSLPALLSGCSVLSRFEDVLSGARVIVIGQKIKRKQCN